MIDLFSGVVLVKMGPLVLVATNKKYGGICLPGGKGELGESPLDAAYRELNEETGFSGSGLVPIATGPSCVEAARMVHMFLAETVCGDLKPETGCDTYFTSWGCLLEESPFSPFYRQHFPRGIWHLRDTNWSYLR